MTALYGVRKVQDLTKYQIHGGRPLHGTIEISGAKNAAVAIIPATVLAQGKCVIENIPNISDSAVLPTSARKLTAAMARMSPHSPRASFNSVLFNRSMEMEILS